MNPSSSGRVSRFISTQTSFSQNACGVRSLRIVLTSEKADVSEASADSKVLCLKGKHPQMTTQSLTSSSCDVTDTICSSSFGRVSSSISAPTCKVVQGGARWCYSNTLAQ